MNYMPTLRRAVFLDKDGTLIPDVPYNVDPSRIKLSDGAVEGMKLLKSYGFIFIIVSNQAGVAHGYFSEQELILAKERIEELLAEHSIFISGFYYCPHHPHGKVTAFAKECECRKPEPGLFFRAAKELNVDLTCSWMIGDILNDVEAGHRAGCKAILLNQGNETEWCINNLRCPDYTAGNLFEAAHSILKHERLCVLNN